MGIPAGNGDPRGTGMGIEIPPWRRSGTGTGNEFDGGEKDGEVSPPAPPPPNQNPKKKKNPQITIKKF